LVIIGLVIASNAMGITSVNLFFKGWWTVFIIVPSFIGLFKNESKIWNIIWFVVGIALLLSAQGILSFALIGKLIFPFILVVIGISIIFKDVINKSVSENIKKLNSEKENVQNICATFGSQEMNLAGQEFNGANVEAIFGGIELRLEDAIITKDQVINANAIFGGIEITVPRNVNVKVKSTPIFGGTSNKSHTNYIENLPTIYINSNAIFGGVEIK